MKQLDPADRRSLRARAHSLDPVVIVGRTGLADSVMAEMERCLQAHELIKIRVCSDDRAQREDLLVRICRRTGASPVQHIGKILVVYRESPASPAPSRSPAVRLEAKTRARRRSGTAPHDREPGAGIRQRSAPRPTSRRRP